MVATPIGNMEDISARALRILAEVNVIAAEDTRHSARLCGHFGIATPMVSMHEYNEVSRIGELLHRMDEGQSVAIVSDAGTPLISDPGYPLVKAVRDQGGEIVPIPGPSALIAALSVAGLPGNRFVFEGFLPAKQAARAARLDALKFEMRTIVFYESTHRIRATLKDLATVFESRQVVVTRELTKVYETVLSGTAASITRLMEEDPNQLRGEFVVLVAGSQQPRAVAELDVDKLLGLLLSELPATKAAGVVAKISPYSKKEIYAKALTLKKGKV